MKIKDALIDEDIDYREFKSMLQDAGIGDWDSINSTEVIEAYIAEMMPQGIHVSHMLKALETADQAGNDDWHVWLGNSMETPTPINSKQDLLTALGIWEEEELEQEIEKQYDYDDYDDGSIPGCDCGCN